MSTDSNRRCGFRAASALTAGREDDPTVLPAAPTLAKVENELARLVDLLTTLLDRLDEEARR